MSGLIRQRKDFTWILKSIFSATITEVMLFICGRMKEKNMLNSEVVCEYVNT